MNDDKDKTSPDQGRKFKDAARQLGTDENEARWEERLRRVAKQRPPKNEE